VTDFSRVETEFERLKAEFESGALAEADFKAQLEELMIEDEQGQWWIIGYESGLWYYHDGDQWIQSDPPPVVQRREQAEALQSEGRAALSAGDWQSAVDRFEAVLALEPEHAQAQAGLEEARARLQAQAEAQTLVGASAQPEPPSPAEPEPEAQVGAVPTPVREEEPEVIPVAKGVPAIRPAAREEAEPVPTGPRRRTIWIVAAVILVIVVAIVLSQILPLSSPEPEFGMWADRDVIQPGECTLLLWKAPGFESVRVVGPGESGSTLLPPTGDLEVCPEATSWYELKSPDWEELSRVQVQVR
jgi:hypothetical protein